jgi:dienelactone hydrolase
MNSNNDGRLTRRTLLKNGGLGLLGATLTGAPGVTAAEKTTKSAPARPAALVPLNRFGRMLQEDLVRRVREVERAGEARRAALRTKADAEAYVRDVRAKIAQCFGPWPIKTPLNPRTTGVLERDAYVVEKVIFESRPQFPVTANLYLPRGVGSARLPAVVGACGHSTEGKAVAPYQSFAQGLARLGYVVLIFDPLGQGERLQYLDASGKSRPGPGVREHLLAGNQQFLLGESLAAWRAWDGIRALDYLLTRPEVDSARVGVTGNSGGGTETAWLCGVESRWAMAAPSCFITTFRRNAENELPADTEQMVPRALALGLDHSDFIAALAPKPVILLGQERDYFDARGLEEAHARLRRLYALLGAEQDIGLFIGPDEHGYAQPVREAMYRWFDRVTRGGAPRPEPALKLEKEADLWCTKSGQVAETQPRTVFSFTAERAKALAAARAPVAAAALPPLLRTVLKLPATTGAPDYRILRPERGRGYPAKNATTYAVETEPGIHAIVYRLGSATHLSRPPRPAAGAAVLYVADRSADEELRSEPLIAEVMKAEPDAAVFACDVRGVGESQPTTCGAAFDAPYGSDYFYAAHALMLDYPMPGQRTHDVLRVIAWLEAHGHTKIHLVARGRGALPAALAAVLAPAVTRVTLKRALTSFGDVATTEYYTWPLSALVPDVLRHFDLPDVYRALEAKQLRQIEPAGGASAS